MRRLRTSFPFSVFRAWLSLRREIEGTPKGGREGEGPQKESLSLFPPCRGEFRGLPSGRAQNNGGGTRTKRKGERPLVRRRPSQQGEKPKNAQTLNDIDWGVGRAEAYFLAYDLGTLWRENVGGALPDLEGER